MTILTPIDFSGASDDVVKAASELAGILGAKIVLLHVVQPPVVTSDFGVGLENVQELMVISEKTATKNLDRQTARLAKKGLQVEGIVTTGSPIASIIKEADRVGARYIVMGSHGHTAFYDLLVGSTTQGVLKRAKCPVVVLPTQRSSRKKARKK